MMQKDGSEIERLTQRIRSRSKRTCRIADRRRRGRYVMDHNGAGTHDRPFTHLHAGQEESAGADEGVGADVDWAGLEGPVGIAKVMGACAEVGLLGHTGTGTDLHHPEAVGVGAVAEAGLVVQGEVPGVIDARPLMHEWPAVKRRPKASQDEQAPEVTGLGGPKTEQRPGKLPEQLAKAVAPSPGAGVAAGLGVGMHQSGRCWISSSKKSRNR